MIYVSLFYFPECGIYPADVVFVLDSSGSVGTSDFGVQLSFVTSFINALDDISTDTSSTHVAVITYGDSVYQSIPLNQYTNKQNLINDVANMQ